MSDPTLLTQKYGTCLIIGKTSSGKTTLIKKILRKLPSSVDIYTINVKNSEYPNRALKIDFEQLATVPSKSVIIVEDVISMTPAESKALREALNYSAHHKKQKIFVITHHVYKTSIFQMLPYFNFVIFTASNSNLPILRIILQSSQIAKDQIDQWSLFFKSAHLYSYFIFDSSKLTFLRADNVNAFFQKNFKSHTGVTNITTPTIGDLTARFDSFLGDHKHKNSAVAIFSILINALPSLKNINPVDLSLQCIDRKQKTISISLVDYVISLLRSKSSISKENLFVHKYFMKYCKIPDIFIKNKQYK